MAVDVNAYAKSLMDAAGISDAAQVDVLNKFFTSDKVRGLLEPTLREATEGIQREQGRTLAEKTRADKAVADQNAYYQQQLKVFNDNKAVFDQTAAQLKAYADIYGELPDGSRPTQQNINLATQNLIDKDTFDKRTTALESNTVGLVTTAIKLMDQHRREFPDLPFDVDGLVKTATEKGMSAQQAYDAMVQGKRTELQTARFEAEKKAAVEAALIEERSKRGIGAVTDAAPKSEFMSNLAKQAAPTTSQESFIKGWREPDPKAAIQREFGRR